MEQSSNETTNQQERQLNLAWLAGLWEGEGTFSVVAGSKGRLFPRASIINTDYVLMSKVIKVLDENALGHYVQFRKGGCDGDPRHKDAMVITIAGMKRVRSLLEAVMKHLHGKKYYTAALVFTFVQQRLSKGPQSKYDADDFDLVKKIRDSNKKGPVESSETTCQPLLATGEDIVQVV